MGAPATFEEQERDGVPVILLKGDLTLPQLKDFPKRLGALAPAGDSRIDLAQVTDMDTVGAWLIYKLRRDAGGGLEIVGASRQMLQLIERVSAHDRPVQIHPTHLPPIHRILGEIGEATVVAIQTFGGFLAFFGQTLLATLASVLHWRRFRINSIIRQFEVVGVKALGIVGLMSFLVGIVIAQQGAVQLRQFGAEVFVINLVGRITLRELGVLMTAIMVAGRSGSAFAAQIGSMKLAEEIDAMRTIGLSPFEVLVVPRTIAATLMMPLLGFYASVLSIIGGGILCWISLDIPPATFVQRLREVVPITDLWVGLVKAPVFGAIIGVTGCFQGMLVKGNVEEVGLRTTSAVVQGIFLVIVLDAFFAVFFTAVGWD